MIDYKLDGSKEFVVIILTALTLVQILNAPTAVTVVAVVVLCICLVASYISFRRSEIITDVVMPSHEKMRKITLNPTQDFPQCPRKIQLISSSDTHGKRHSLSIDDDLYDLSVKTDSVLMAKLSGQKSGSKVKLVIERYHEIVKGTLVPALVGTLTIVTECQDSKSVVITTPVLLGRIDIVE